MEYVRLIKADSRRIPLADQSVHCCVTSPPYWGLRDYGESRQLGLESTPKAYVAAMVGVFREVKRVLRDDGTLWLNIGDTYSSQGGSGSQGKHGGRHNRTHTQRTLINKGSVDSAKPKDLIGIPWMLAFALRADGWYLRSEIIWHKPNPMPESVTDRPTKAHEQIFLLSKSERYFYQESEIREPGARYDWSTQKFKGGDLTRHHGSTKGREEADFSAGRNARSVWSIATRPFPGSHFATFPPELPERCIKAGCPIGGIVLDPFNGAGTTGVVAGALGRRYVGLDVSDDYLAMAQKRIARPHAKIRAERPETPLPLFD